MNRNNNDLYRMYEAEYNKNKKLKQENNELKLEVFYLKDELKRIKANFEKKIEKEVTKILN